MSEANKAIARAIFEIFAGEKDLSGIEQLIAPGAVDHQGMPGVDDPNGPEGFRRIMGVFRGAFPDTKVQVMSIIAEGDLVVGHFRMSGTNTGGFAGMPPTGKPFDVLGCDIIRIANGKAVEHWGYYEEAKMLQQLGVMPSQ